MKENFMNTVQMAMPSGNVFDLGHDVKQTLDMGVLVPFLCQDTLPGDRWTVGAEVMVRFNALMAPVMHKFDVYTHYFYVPNRIVWDGWTDFIKSINSGTPAPAAPYITNFGVGAGDLANYMGLPITAGVGSIDKVSAIPFAGLGKIWNEYYRADFIQPEIDVVLVDGNNDAKKAALLSNRRRAWQMDYFTAQLPNAQRGNPVSIPLGSSAPVQYIGQGGGLGAGVFKNYATGAPIGAGDLFTTSGSNPALNSSGGVPLAYDPNGTLITDLSSATAVTINALRTAWAVQGWAERAARVGDRYTEVIRGFYGVNVPDATLQRPLYLGGSKQPMVISEVLQTSETTATSPQADMAGHGISIGGGKSFSYTCTEHGYIFGLMSVMPRTAYQQGIEAHFSKFDPVQYGWPQFANLGEQPVKNREVYFSPTDGQNDLTFGYMPMYGEYRTKQSRVAGLFATDLSFWHDGRIFSSRPNLNSQFIQCTPDKRIFTVQTDAGSQLLSHVYNHLRVYRLLPKFGTPSLI